MTKMRSSKQHFPSETIASRSRPVILFDFDGTLANSLPAVLRIAKRMAGESNIPMPGPDEINAMRKTHASELLRKFGIPKAKLPFWLNRLRRDLALETPGMGTFAGMAETLAELHRSGIRMGIITSNGEPAVRGFLDQHGWEPFFETIITGSPLFGKARLIRRAVRRLGPESIPVWYAGDELRDIDAARAAGVLSAAVAWGFNDGEILAQAKPDAILHHPEEFWKLMEGRSP